MDKHSEETESRLELVRDLTPEYAAKIESFSGKKLEEALSDKNVAAYVQKRVNMLRDDLNKAKEVFKQHNDLKFLTLFLGDYSASIEW